MDQKPRITHAFGHKANMYNKSMAITTARTSVPCHTMQLSCLYFTYLSFYKSHLVNMFSTMFFSKCQSLCAISITVTVRVVKYACFLEHKIDVHAWKIIMSIM
jgi:predicted PolB exonuclease-like 3'-5' exonuclease